MHTFPRPTQDRLGVVREPVPGSCTECSAADLQRYPVLSEGGWAEVVKCQQCLHSEQRTPLPPLGSYVPLASTL